MKQSQNDRYILSLILATLFIIGIGASVYFIYSLPTELRLAEGYQSEFVDVYLVLAGTFALGIGTLLVSMRYKKEVIVFRDKIIDAAQVQRDIAEQEGRTTISLDSVKASLNNSNAKEALSGFLQSLCKQLDAGQGALYGVTLEDEKRILELRAGYALNIGESATIKFEFGEGLVGQVATSGQSLYVDDVPDGYITILSGLGSASPKFVLLVPIKDADKVTGVIEIASFTRTSEDQRKFVQEAALLVGEKLLKA